MKNVIVTMLSKYLLICSGIEASTLKQRHVQIISTSCKTEIWFLWQAG